jgi:hypothetical protein
LLASCGLLLGGIELQAAPSHAQTPVAEHRLVVFGHSFTWMPPDGPTWPQRLAARKHLRLDNLGIPGAGSSSIAKRVSEYQPRASDTVVIEPFLNDVRYFGLAQDALDRYRRSLKAMLDHLSSPVRPKTIVVLEDPPIRAWKRDFPFNHGSLEAEAAYRTATRDTAALYSAIVVNAARGWDVASMTGPDGVHPTKRGAAFIAGVIAHRLALQAERTRSR